MPITESQILLPRRHDDSRRDLWSVFNRTQENLIKGGLSARAANGRRQTTRPVQGIDPAGYAGLEDGVDWHWGRILVGAALSTMLGVGSELAVSNQGSANGNTVIALRDSSQDTANQVGQEITRRDLSVQPTLTVRPGFQVNVMVNKDLVLRTYQPLFVQQGPMQ